MFLVLLTWIYCLLINRERIRWLKSGNHVQVFKSALVEKCFATVYFLRSFPFWSSYHYRFLTLSLNRGILGQVPSIYHLANFGDMTKQRRPGELTPPDNFFTDPFTDPLLDSLVVITKWKLDTFILLEFLPSNKMVDPCWNWVWPGHY